MKENSTPGPIPGTILAPRDGKCVQCKGQTLKGEYVRPRPGGWVGPCCGSR